MYDAGGVAVSLGGCAAAYFGYAAALFLLGFSSVGAALIPALSGLFGFCSMYAVSCFVRCYGRAGVLLALGALFLASLIFRMAAVGPVLAWLFYFLLSTAMLSVGLGLFNLIPIPPLDGSKVLFALLPDRAYYVLMRYERYGMLLLMALIWLDLGGSFLSNAIAAVFQWMVGLFFAH